MATVGGSMHKERKGSYSMKSRKMKQFNRMKSTRKMRR